jgi:hypothetical protein
MMSVQYLCVPLCWVGAVLFAACAFQVPLLQTLGFKVVEYANIPIGNPFSRRPDGPTVPSMLLVGVFSAVVALFNVREWDIKYGAGVAPPSFKHADMKHEWLGKKWRDERNLYMWALVAVLYLALHAMLQLWRRARAAEAKKQA